MRIWLSSLVRPTIAPRERSFNKPGIGTIDTVSAYTITRDGNPFIEVHETLSCLQDAGPSAEPHRDAVPEVGMSGDRAADARVRGTQ
jgi:hypothetical protein